MTHDVIIVGGGIAGLYASLRCIEEGYRVCCLERDSRWGGRIRTIHRDGEVYEAGAARFHKTHTHIQKLIQRYGIETIPLDSRPRQYRAVMCGAQPVESPAYRSILEVLRKAREHPVRALRTMTFGEFVEKTLGTVAKQEAQAAFGYDGEFDVINAYDGVRMFSKDFGNREAFYACAGGLSSIVDAIVAELQQSKRWDGVLEHRVTGDGIHYEKGVYTIHATMLDGTHIVRKARTLVLALPKQALLDLNIWSAYHTQLLQSVTAVPCERIYARYAKPWFQGSPITTTDLPIRQFIPINDHLAMVSYSDSKQADAWNVTAMGGEDRLTRRIHRQLKELFPDRKVPTRPVWMEAYHWDAAIHMWNPGVVAGRVRRQIQASMEAKGGPVFVCGEAYSPRQCWVEGALITVEEVVALLHKKRSKGGAEGDWRQWVKNKKGKLTQKDLDQLRKLYPDAKWVLFQDRLIDLTEWYFAHPGGQTPYDNHMHRNVYPFFSKISNHYDGKNIKMDVNKKIEKLTIARIMPQNSL